MGEKRYNREREAEKHPAGFISSKSLQYLLLEVRTIFKFVWNCCLFLREKRIIKLKFESLTTYFFLPMLEQALV